MFSLTFQSESLTEILKNQYNVFIEEEFTDENKHLSCKWTYIIVVVAVIGALFGFASMATLVSGAIDNG